MAAVLRALGILCSFSYVLFVFLFFYMLDVVSITVYDRDTLLSIGSSVAQRKPDFEFLNAGGLFTDTASEPFVWVAQSRKRRRPRKRGKRAGVLVRLRRRAFRHPLPTILLANVQSLDNKLCELRARISYQRETRDCCVICLTETWMSAMVPDSAIELTGFSVHRSDRAKELTEKSRGGGVCFYINNLWCNERNLHSIKSFCSPDLEFHMLLTTMRRPTERRWVPLTKWCQENHLSLNIDKTKELVVDYSFSCSHTVLPKEHSLGVIFFLLTFLMLCCIFSSILLAFHYWLYSVWLCMWRIIKNLEPTLNLIIKAKNKDTF